ncbi:O-antigen translocase [Psychroserpens sp. AS72]|uniref:O-antigen translocase n=1 Tax=Psychroserpens sp. AS72 TaxID=3135775 RepID=UPI003170BDD9
MKHKFRYAIGNNLLFRIASLNSLSVLLRVLLGFITSKLIALFIGPSGLAIIGNFRDFFNFSQAFSTLGFNNGTVKYVAEFKNNSKKLTETLSTVFYLTLIAVVIFAILIFINANYISNLIFLNNDYSYIIKYSAFILPIYALKAILISVLNGLSKFKKVIVITIITQVVVIFVNAFLIWQYQLQGALISIITVEVISFLIIVFYAKNYFNYFKLISLNKVKIDHLKNLSAFSLMALFSAITLPLIAVIIRNYIIDEIGAPEAGFWVAIQRISSYYLMFVTTLTTLYILPRFSQLNTAEAFRKEVFDFYKTIVPIFIFGSIVIYLLRYYIIKIVFSDEFEPVTDLFFWQQFGDLFKVLSIVISYQFLAKKMVKHYIIVESLAILTIYMSSIFFIDNFGLEGVVIAHFVSYLIHFIILLFIFRKSLFSKALKFL